MNPRMLHDELSVRPFHPIAIVTSSGDHYMIRHPERAVPAPDQLYIFESPGSDEIVKPIRVSYNHIVTIEPVSDAAA